MKLKKSEKKKKIILEAAIKVFARKGFDKTRISDIAREAKVAYGLVYHYYKGKDKILHVIFTETWNIFLKVLEEIFYDEGITFREKIYNLVSFLINSYINFPELIEVIIIEVIHSNRIKNREYMKGFMKSFLILEKALKEHSARKEIKSSLNLRLTTIMIFGSLEMIFSGFALKGLSLNDFNNEDELKEKIVDLIMKGIAAENG